MRRLGFFGAAVLLVLAVAGPVSGAERVRESGTFSSFSSFSTTCSGNTCSDTILDVFSLDSDTVAVCVTEVTYNSRTGRETSYSSGCTETDASVLSISSGFAVTLASTDVTLANCNQRRCVEGDTVTVAASDTATGPIQTVTGRVTIRDGSCTTRISFRDQSAEVAGTLTIDGTTLSEQGFATISDQTATTICR